MPPGPVSMPSPSPGPRSTTSTCTTPAGTSAATTRTRDDDGRPDALPLRPCAAEPLAPADLDRRHDRAAVVLAAPVQPALPAHHRAARLRHDVVHRPPHPGRR